MKKSVARLFLFAFVFLLLVSVVSAVWWNPFTWFEQSQDVRLSPSDELEVNNITKLVAYWAFNESSYVGATGEVREYKGVSPGTTVGFLVPNLVLGLKGNAVNFTNYYGQRIAISTTPTNFNLNSFTLSAWVKTSDAGAGRRRIFSQQTGSYYGIALQGNNLECFSSYDLGVVQFNRLLNDNQWHHVSCVRNTGNEFVFYVDGVRVRSNSLVGTSTSSYNMGSDYILIGKYAGSENENFIGLIDEVRVYNEALTDGQISQVYNFDKQDFVSGSTSNSTSNSTCIDSDGGLNYNVSSYITAHNFTGVYNASDYCRSNNTQLVEYYCDPNVASLGAYSAYNCPNGCSNGACLSPSTSNIGTVQFINNTIRVLVNSYPTLTPTTLPSGASQFRGFYELSWEYNTSNYGVARSVGYSVYPNSSYPYLIIPNFNFNQYDLYSNSNVSFYLQEYPWGSYPYNRIFIDSIAPPKSTCIDSDGGANHNVKGNVTYTNVSGVTVIQDYCMPGNDIADIVCIPNLQYNYPYSLNISNCPNGCSNGACLAPVNLINVTYGITDNRTSMNITGSVNPFGVQIYNASFFRQCVLSSSNVLMTYFNCTNIPTGIYTVNAYAKGYYNSTGIYSFPSSVSGSTRLEPLAPPPAEVVSANLKYLGRTVDRVGVYNLSIPDGRPEFELELELNSTLSGSITGATLNHNFAGEWWSTNKAGSYLIWFSSSSMRLNSAIGQTIPYSSGKTKFILMVQPVHLPFEGGKLNITLSSGKNFAVSVPKPSTKACL